MYYESHVNVAMPESESSHWLDDMRACARDHRMKVTVMDGHDHLPDGRTREVVITGHSQDQYDLENRVRRIVWRLRSENERVTRYKLEKALVDSRVVDSWGLLDA